MLGWLGVLTSLCISLPQFLLVVRTGNTRGIAVMSWMIGLGTGLAWLSHGIKLASVPQIVCNSWGLVATLVILWFLHRNRRYTPWLLVVPGLILALALVGLDWRVSSAAFGMAVIVPGAFGMLRQGLALMRAPNVTGVAIPTWIAQVINQIVWISWGVVGHDAGIKISASVSLVVASFVLTLRLLRAAGHGPWLSRDPLRGLSFLTRRLVSTGRR